MRSGLAAPRMNNRIENIKGENKVDCMKQITEKFQEYQIITEKTYIEKWYLFWKKTHEVILMVPVHKTEKNTLNEKPKKNPQKQLKEVDIEVRKPEELKKETIKPMQMKPLPLPMDGNGKIKKTKDFTDVERERKKNELLIKLGKPNGMDEIVEAAKNHTEDADKSIAELKLMIETLIQKIGENDGNKILPMPFEKMKIFLKDQEVEDRTARIFVEKIEEKMRDKPIIEDEEVAISVQKMIESQINIHGPIDKEKVKTIAFVGPTGVGKTTTLAKLGWELHRNDRTVGFITTDTFRSGAKEQLNELAELMDTEVIVARGAKELKEAIQYFENVNQVDHILIDTVGRNPMVNESIEAVSEYLDISNPDLTCLVLSSTSKVKDLKEILAQFKQVKVDGLIFTKLDETFNVGSVLNVFNYTKLPVVYVTDGQDITKNIYAPTKKILAEKIMKKETSLQGKVIV